MRLYAWVAAKGTDLGMALVEFMDALTKSIIKSGQALADGKDELQVKEPEGFIKVDTLY